jgi:hypothetical protein
MHREVDLKLSLEEPLSYLFVFLPGYHLHNRQRQAQRPSLRFPLGKCLNGNSIPGRERIGNCFKFLAIDADPFGPRITHALEFVADLVQFN